MILTTILLITLIAIAATAALTIAVGGTAFIAIFGDIIVFIAAIILITRLFGRKKNKKGHKRSLYKFMISYVDVLFLCTIDTFNL